MKSALQKPKARINLIGVIIRARTDASTQGQENAWVSLIIMQGQQEKIERVMGFSADEYGVKAWSRAVKYGKDLSARLGVPLLRKRGTSAAKSAKTVFAGSDLYPD